MKKITVLFLSLLIFLLCVTPAGAVNAGQQSRQEQREEIRIETKNNAGTPSAEKKQNLFKNIWGRLTKRFPNILPAGINKAAIVSFSQKTLPAEITVDNKGQTIILKVDENTNILRKFGGKSTLSEMNVGDIVSARGEWQDSNQAILKTRVLRDLSIKKRKGTFWGKITAIDSVKKTFTLETSQRSTQTVFVVEGTKIIDRRERAIAFGDLVIGHRVRVTGVWDNTLNKIDEVKTIKDWSIGPNPTGTLSATPIQEP